MRPATRTMFRNAAVAILPLSVVGWLLPIDGDLGELLPLALFFVAFALGAVWFVSTPTAAHEAEDVLGERFGSYFEGDGLCFAAGFVRLSDGRRGKIEVELPQNVADVIPPGFVTHAELISEWDPPTGGFPVS